ncbi:hypothetical protein [Streptomyces formicae]|uniref:Phage protein n=1 Tax=Streptomyces formicae TaxID=1616117 RepID=A0ABY3WR57_9ACTN|nr:hypothetical protein [Streptomyces formicae]UNM12293.1 hypothetical protein J4032_12810 [Streptomyces formicae]
MWTTVTHRFERVPLTAKKAVECEGCGKKLRRQRTFEQTINPWNKTADGEVKTYKHIYPELEAKAAAWKAEPEVCRDCEGGTDDTGHGFAGSL